MAEYRVKITISNWQDEELSSMGRRAPDDVRIYSGDALVDPERMRCLLPLSVVELLHLRTKPLGFPTGELGGESFLVTSPFRVGLFDRVEVETAFVSGDDVVVGQVVLGKMDLVIDRVRNVVIPNPLHPNGPVNRV